MDTHVYEEFLNGSWTLNRPVTPGVYPVCAVGMTETQTTLTVAMRLNGSLFIPPWSGWWWTHPFPDNWGLPTPPKEVPVRRSSDYPR